MLKRNKYMQQKFIYRMEIEDIFQGSGQETEE